MKRFAVALITAGLTAGAAAPALANVDDIKVDSHIVDINAPAGLIKLANGMTLDRSVEYFAMPVGASAGDKVRVVFTDDNVLKRVLVLR